MQFDYLDETQVHEHDVLGTTVISRVPHEYEGPTMLEAISGKTTMAVFPDYRQALGAARFAVSELGGYAKAILTRSTPDEVTHSHWEDWAFEF